MYPSRIMHSRTECDILRQTRLGPGLLTYVRSCSFRTCVPSSALPSPHVRLIMQVTGLERKHPPSGRRDIPPDNFPSVLDRSGIFPGWPKGSFAGVEKLFREGFGPMSAGHVFTWLLTLPAGGMVVVAILRCVALFAGFRMTYKKASKADLLPLYREFARALVTKRHQRESDPPSYETVDDRGRPWQTRSRVRRNPEESERQPKRLPRVGEQRGRLHGSHCERLHHKRDRTTVPSRPR